MNYVLILLPWKKSHLSVYTRFIMFFQMSTEINNVLLVLVLLIIICLWYYLFEEN